MKKHYNGDTIRTIFEFLHEHIIAIIIAVVVIAGAVSTIYIIKDDNAEKQLESESTKYENVNTVYLSMTNVQSLNPLTSQDKDTYYISQLMYSSLFKLDETLNIKPDIVDSYNTNSAEGSVTLKLKDNVKFSDGSDLTAYDVRYTVNEILSVGKSCPYYEYMSKIDYIDVSSDHKMTVYFNSPSDAALDNLVFPIVSGSDYSASESHVLGSGQYCLRSYDSMKSLKLKPNKYYYGKKAENKVQFNIIPDKSKTTGLMTMDAVTAFVNTSSDADVEGEDKKLRVTAIPSAEVEYLGFNFKNKYLSDANVRKAIAKSIDIESLIHDNYGNAAVSSDSIYFPGFLGSENKGDAYEQDQLGAAKLLASAGYKDIDEDGILEDDKKREMELTILVNEGNSGRIDTAYGIAEGLERLGITTDVKVLSKDRYKSALRKGKFDIYIGGYKFDKKFDLREMFKKGNPINYKNQEVLSLVKKMETSLSAEKQKEVFGKLKPLLTEDLPYYCLCYKNYTFMTVNKFTAEEIPTFFDFYRGCSTWRWQKTVTVKADETKDTKQDTKE